MHMHSRNVILDPAGFIILENIIRYASLWQGSQYFNPSKSSGRCKSEHFHTSMAHRESIRLLSIFKVENPMAQLLKWGY